MSESHKHQNPRMAELCRMIQIAIFSDVHGNLPALNTVLKDIKSRKIEQMFCLGDLVDFAPWGNEVIEKIQTENILCLLGNHDERVAFNLPIIPLPKHTVEESAARITAINHSKQTIKDANKAFLATRPYNLKLNYKVGAKHWNIQLVHASLDSNEHYLYVTENDNVFLDQLNRSQSDVLVMGHTHLSFVKNINGKMAINCGSVGRSKESNKLASYLLLTLMEKEVVPEIIQLEYPIKEVISKIKESDIPNYYAHFLQATT